MFVADWMTRTVQTVRNDDSVSQAIKIMKEKKIKHLPVVNRKGDLVGILSDRDIKEYSPSKATTLDVYELHNVLFETKVQKIMKKDVVTVGATTPIEEAAMVMYDRNIGCLPVLEDGRMTGIISDRDLFRVLVDITGIRNGGQRFYVSIRDKLGATTEVLEIVRGHGFSIDSVLTTYEGTEKGFKRVVVRTKGPEGDVEGANKAFRDKFGLQFFPTM